MHSTFNQNGPSLDGTPKIRMESQQSLNVHPFVLARKHSSANHLTMSVLTSFAGNPKQEKAKKESLWLKMKQAPNMVKEET
jgi:hypothetical protein